MTSYPVMSLGTNCIYIYICHKISRSLPHEEYCCHKHNAGTKFYNDMHYCCLHEGWNMHNHISKAFLISHCSWCYNTTYASCRRRSPSDVFYLRMLLNYKHKIEEKCYTDMLKLPSGYDDGKCVEVLTKNYKALSLINFTNLSVIVSMWPCWSNPRQLFDNFCKIGPMTSTYKHNKTDLQQWPTPGDGSDCY